MESDSGFYQLYVKLPSTQKIRAGNLGVFTFPAGLYVYTGSARRGLHARIARHLRKQKKLRWHIDYFLRYGLIYKVKLFENRELTECKLNGRIMKKRGTKIIAKGFGSSDCKCVSHLVYLGKK